MPEETPLPPSPLRRHKKQRIADKLFLSYVLPLAVLIVAGIMLPVFLWSYLGKPAEEYGFRVRYAALVEEMQRTAVDSEQVIRGYLLFKDTNFISEFNTTRTKFNEVYRDLQSQVEAIQSPHIKAQLESAHNKYVEWVRTYVMPEVRNRPLQSQRTDKPDPASVLRSSRMRVAFVSVRSELDALVASTKKHKEEQLERANFADMLRSITSIAIPGASVLLAMLIGRSIALGITRPLESLTEAAVKLEQGDANPLVIADSMGSEYADDEIGELQRSFQQMARTIGHREAVLRAQNDALGALNRRVEAVLNATNDGIVLLDRTGAFAVVNNRFGELFGIEPEVLVDQSYEQAAPLLISRFKNRAEVRLRLDKLVHDSGAMVEDIFEIAEPVARILRIYSAPVQGSLDVDGEDDTETQLGRIFVFRDVTRETMVDRMKTEFVATVSHELRTPLTAIKGYIDLMLGGKTGPLTNVQSEFLTMTQHSTERLTALINDMLDISRIESGRMEIRQETVDYLPLAEQTVRLMQAEAQKKQIHLELDVQEGSLLQVRGDSDRITQALVNFISNGIKYTPQGGTVRVTIESNDDFVTTCVSDTGVGIASRDLPRLFQKFFRADNSTTRETGGTGLGLAITKAILEKLGGSVWVESEVGKGSKFWFTLPSALPVSLPSEDSPAPLETTHNKRSNGQEALILSVDGNTATLHRLGHELRRQNFVTSNAATPMDALRRAKGLHPDLITLDVLSPNFDGFRFLRSLRETPETAQLPVALMTLHDTGSRFEVSDGVRIIPRDIEQIALTHEIRTALGPKALGDESASASRGTRAVTLVVGDYALAERIRDILGNISTVHIVATSSPEEADSRVSGLFPDLVIVDTQATPEGTLGEWVARLRNRRPGVRLSLIVLTDPEILQGRTFPLITPGAGPVGLSRIGGVLNRVLNTSASVSMTEANSKEILP
jgi:two-component system phosphate regulon sensor histidine kinase PhoR